MSQTKADQDNVVEYLEDNDIKETKAEKENTSKEYVCNICGISFVYEDVSNIHKDCTICNIQFNDLKSLNQHFFVKHKL